METNMDNEKETGCMQGFLEIMQDQTGYWHRRGKTWADGIPLDATKPSNRVWSKQMLAGCQLLTTGAPSSRYTSRKRTRPITSAQTCGTTSSYQFLKDPSFGKCSSCAACQTVAEKLVSDLTDLKMPLSMQQRRIKEGVMDSVSTLSPNNPWK